jgi:pilus assembly protein CpaB
MVFGMGAFVLSMNVISGYVNTKQVVVVARDVEPFTMIEQKDVMLLNMPSAAIPNGCFVDVDDVIGRVSLSKLYSGHILLRRQTVEDGEKSPLSFAIPEGQRAIMVPVTLQGLTGLLSQGEKVDIIYAPNKTAAGIFDTELSQVLPSVSVLRVIEDPSSRGIAGVVITGTPEECLWVAEHSERGSLHIALVSARDRPQDF